MARYILWHKKKHHTLIQLFVAPRTLRKIGLQENSKLSDNEREDRSTYIINKYELYALPTINNANICCDFIPIYMS